MNVFLDFHLRLICTCRFYDNLSVVSLGSLVVCGVGGAALWMGVAASGRLVGREEAPLGSLESGLSWLALTSGWRIFLKNREGNSQQKRRRMSKMNRMGA